MCLDIHAKFRGDRPLRGRDLKGGGGQIDPPPPPPPSKNLLSKSPVKIGLNTICVSNVFSTYKNALDFGGYSFI